MENSNGMPVNQAPLNAQKAVGQVMSQVLQKTAQKNINNNPNTQLAGGGGNIGKS